MSKGASSGRPASTERRGTGDDPPGQPIPDLRGAKPSLTGRREEIESSDFAILRECFGDVGASIGFDPRRSPEIIARTLKVSPATVRRRIGMWRDRGFLLGFDVIPHPDLLGGRLVTCLLDFQNPIAQERAIETLSLIDGMIQIDPARTTLLAVYFVDSESQSERRRRQFQSVEGVKDIGPELPFVFPPCSHRMSRPDWRLIRAVRKSPEATLAELAEEVGRSTRTTSRRYNSLLDDRAMMFDPILEFSRFNQTLADLVVSLDRAERSGETEAAIRRMCPQVIRAWGSPMVDLTGGQAPTLHFWVSAPTSAELDGLSGRVAHLPGVNQVALWYGRSTLPVRTWLDERIEAFLKSDGPTG